MIAGALAFGVGLAAIALSGSRAPAGGGSIGAACEVGPCRDGIAKDCPGGCVCVGGRCIHGGQHNPPPQPGPVGGGCPSCPAETTCIPATGICLPTILPPPPLPLPCGSVSDCVPGEVCLGICRRCFSWGDCVSQYGSGWTCEEGTCTTPLPDLSAAVAFLDPPIYLPSGVIPQGVPFSLDARFAYVGPPNVAQVGMTIASSFLGELGCNYALGSQQLVAIPSSEGPNPIEVVIQGDGLVLPFGCLLCNGPFGVFDVTPYLVIAGQTVYGPTLPRALTC